MGEVLERLAELRRLERDRFKMNPVMLTDWWDKQCVLHGKHMAEVYRTTGAGRAATLQVENRKIDQDVFAQAEGRRHEVGFCIWGGLDPGILNWDSHQPDVGSVDLRLGSIKIDVKGSSNPKSTCLIWPASKTHFYDELDFDVLAFVRSGEDPRWQRVMGWMPKDVFRDRKIEAGEGDPRGFEPGTWYVEEYYPPGDLAVYL